MQLSDYLKNKIKREIKGIKRIFFPNRVQNYKIYQKALNKKSGVEIGGPSNFFRRNRYLPLYSVISNLDGINYSADTVWTGKIDMSDGYQVDGKRLGNQYFFDAVDIRGISSGTYDFVLSCNNLEHIANPLKAIAEWLRILKSDGYLLIVVPRKESNFDHKRETTSFSHLLDDYKNNINESDLTHLNEILEKHDLQRDPPAGTFEQFKERSLKNFENRCLHHHVFDMNLMEGIYTYFNLEIICTSVINSDYIILGRKRV